MEKLAFGGGCHWCTEGVFQALRGVEKVDQGFVQSDAPADTWAEGVIVTFDPSVIQLATLSEVHLRTHSATRARSLRSKYRSAIYIFEDRQRHEAELAIAGFAHESGDAVHTGTSVTRTTIEPTRAGLSAAAILTLSWISSDGTSQRSRSLKCGPRCEESLRGSFCLGPSVSDAPRASTNLFACDTEIAKVLSTAHWCQRKG